MNFPQLKELPVWSDAPQHPMLEQLKAYQAWRRGEDKRTLAETTLTPTVIGQCIDWAIAEIERLQQLGKGE